jgi:hypothetical protein
VRFLPRNGREKGFYHETHESHEMVGKTIRTRGICVTVPVAVRLESSSFAALRVSASLRLIKAVNACAARLSPPSFAAL